MIGDSEPVATRRFGPAAVTLVRLDVSDAEAAACLALLSPAERARADRYRLERDRRRFLVRRAKLRMLLAEALACRPEAVPIEADPHGKPFVEGHPGLAFNLSHARDAALVAIGRDVALGCDLEWRDPELACARVAERLFAPRERAALAQLPPGRWVEGFYNCWTRKEAYVKALGLGLSYPLVAFSVSVGPGARPALNGADAGWSLWSFEPLAGYQAALASGPDPVRSGLPYGLPRAIATASRTSSRANSHSQPA